MTDPTRDLYLAVLPARVRYINDEISEKQFRAECERLGFEPWQVSMILHGAYLYKVDWQGRRAWEVSK